MHWGQSRYALYASYAGRDCHLSALVTWPNRAVAGKQSRFVIEHLFTKQVSHGFQEVDEFLGLQFAAKIVDLLPNQRIMTGPLLLLVASLDVCYWS